MPRALITGITGQDGTYLCDMLRSEGYELHGTTGPGHHGDPEALRDVQVHTLDMRETGALRALIEETEPDDIYNLAALSSVYQSWQNPIDTAHINGVAVAEVLAAAWDLQERADKTVTVVQANSAELSGNPLESPQTETTPIRPSSPYGAAKAYAHHLVGVYRGRGLRASSAILYNHESPLRPETFVTRKISAGVARISAGHQDVIELGTLEVNRDWGWAPDYARALRLMASHEPDDFVIATGIIHSITDFLNVAFARVGIENWQPYVRVSGKFARPVDPVEQVGNPSKACHTLGWHTTKTFEEIVHAMVDHDLELLARGGGPA